FGPPAPASSTPLPGLLKGSLGLPPVTLTKRNLAHHGKEPGHHPAAIQRLFHDATSLRVLLGFLKAPQREAESPQGSQTRTFVLDTADLSVELQRFRIQRNRAP